MVSALISRLVVLFVGTLYPAYGSYKAIRSKNAREYIHWIMYWICFALFTFLETFSDIFLAFWIPFYYEMKILFLAWLLCPATKGSAVLYKNFVHPRLVKHEQDIDEMIETAKQNGFSAMYHLGSRGAQYASQLLATTALKGQQVLLSQLQRSYSQGDVTDAAAILGRDEEPQTFRRAASRSFSIKTRKLIRSEPAFSDEEEEEQQHEEEEQEDFQIIDENLAATDELVAMDIEQVPKLRPAKKKGTYCSNVRSQRVYLDESSELSDIDSNESVSSDVDSVDSYGTTNRQKQDDSDYDWKPMTRSKVQRKAAVSKKSSPKRNLNSSNNSSSSSNSSNNNNSNNNNNANNSNSNNVTRRVR